jgi:hypothetical protein
VPTRAVSMREGAVLWLAPGTAVKWPGIAGRHVRDVSLEERWQWKDELKVPVERGFVTRDRESGFRAEDERVSARVAVPDGVGGLAAGFVVASPSVPDGWDVS